VNNYNKELQAQNIITPYSSRPALLVGQERAWGGRSSDTELFLSMIRQRLKRKRETGAGVRGHRDKMELQPVTFKHLVRIQDALKTIICLKEKTRENWKKKHRHKN